MKIKAEIEIDLNTEISHDEDFDLPSLVLMQLALKPDEIYFSQIKPEMNSGVPRLIKNAIISLLQNKNITSVAVTDILKSSNKFYSDVVDYCACPLTDEICLYLLDKAPLNHTVVSGIVNSANVSDNILKIIIDTTKSNTIKNKARDRLNESLHNKNKIPCI